VKSQINATLFLAALTAARLVHADDTLPTEDSITKAAQGDTHAQVSLAVRYRDGKGVKKDYAEAMRWAHLAADRGDAATMDFVGFAYLNGEGVHRSPEVAVGYFQATAFLRSELDAGCPVVIDFKFSGPDYPGGEAGHTLGVAGYVATENTYILCNPATPTPGLQLMTAEDLKRYWRSDHYGELSNGVLSRPSIVIAKP